MDNGWIKLHRKIQDWEWYQNSEMVHLFLHFLLLANHEPGKWQGQQIETGQFITGRIELSQKTGISQQTIRTCIARLKSTNEITVKSTNKFSIITLVKWKDYQIKGQSSTTKSTSQLTNEQPTTNQQLTTNKKNKEFKKKEEVEEAFFKNPLMEQITQTYPDRNYEFQFNLMIDWWQAKKKKLPQSISAFSNWLKFTKPDESLQAERRRKLDQDELAKKQQEMTAIPQNLDKLNELKSKLNLKSF